MTSFLENNLFKTLYDAIPFETYVMDVKTYEIIYMNRAMVDKRGDKIGEVCHKALFEEDTPCFHCKNHLLVNKDGSPNGQSYVFENFNPFDDRWYQLQEKTLGWPDGRTVKCSVAVDITELKATQNRLAEAHAELALKNKELESLSVTDRLTGLFNRLKLDGTLQQEVGRAERYGHPFSVIMLDIDCFKLVNDELGHQAGDSALQFVADTLRSNIREVDVVGRWGGEEFLILCPDTALDGACLIAEKIRVQIESACVVSKFRLTASFGVTQFAPGDTISSLVTRADKAMYLAKANGRNRVERIEAG